MNKMTKAHNNITKTEMKLNKMKLSKLKLKN